MARIRKECAEKAIDVLKKASRPKKSKRKSKRSKKSAKASKRSAPRKSRKSPKGKRGTARKITRRKMKQKYGLPIDIDIVPTIRVFVLESDGNRTQLEAIVDEKPAPEAPAEAASESQEPTAQ